MKTSKAVIIKNDLIADCIYKMVLYFTDGFDTLPVPGQFINIAVPDSSHILRRPISINDVSLDDQTITIIYQVRGEGTQIFSKLVIGDNLDVFYFLGKGFTLSSDAKRVLLIGGGVGVAPLLYCAKFWSEQAIFDSILGYRSGKYGYCIDEFDNSCGNSLIATEDGTLGNKGYVTDVLKKYLLDYSPDCIMACGPLPMLKAVKMVAQENNIPCQISLEEHMGCGMGACLVCNCKIKSADGFDYLRVCADGPVFDAEEVIF